MRKLTNKEVNNLKSFTEHSIEVTLIEPTETGLTKAILDATYLVRSFLKTHGLHDYDLQVQGPNAKVLLSSFLLTSDKILPSTASLYRPVTKQGDPRIWFKGLGSFAAANDILAIFTFSGSLYVINISKEDVSSLIADVNTNPLKELVGEISASENLVADELLKMLVKICKQGPIPGLLNADTAIGRTLESLLGISINSSKKPDFKGIELKSYRDKRTNRKTLFAQVPDWSISQFKSSAEILDNFGYLRGVDKKLNCTVSTLTRNSQGLKLFFDPKSGHLTENSVDLAVGDFAHWTSSVLHKRLLEKHNETFWIAATSSIHDGKEHFHYTKVEHTKKPILTQFDVLLEQGLITVDHLIKRSNNKVVERGPLFKIKPNALPLLFPPSQKYDLQ